MKKIVLTLLFSVACFAQKVTITPSASGGHIIALSWTNPTAVPPQTAAVTNNIYRATGSCASFVKIASVSAISPTTTYSDSDPALTSGNTYCYVIASADSTGVEAQTRSNTSQVTIPKSSVCTPTTPCAAVTVTNTSMTANVVTGSGGSQVSGPGVAILWSCVGSATNCSAANLNTNIQQLANGQPINGYWDYVSFPQAANSVTYLDQQPNGYLMNYAVANQWNSSNAATGAAAGPVSGITIFTMPAAPAATVPTAPSAPSVAPNTTGTPGPQSTPNKPAPPKTRPKQPQKPAAKAQTSRSQSES